MLVMPERRMRALFPSLLIVLAISSGAAAKSCGSEIPDLDELRQTIQAASERRPVSITFRTGADGVQLSQHLRLQYPDEMTVVLQYQFLDLVVGADRLKVGLEFKGAPERIIIPFDAITALYDSSVRAC
jgi:hypothetical protein